MYSSSSATIEGEALSTDLMDSSKVEYVDVGSSERSAVLVDTNSVDCKSLEMSGSCEEGLEVDGIFSIVGSWVITLVT